MDSTLSIRLNKSRSSIFHRMHMGGHRKYFLWMTLNQHEHRNLSSAKERHFTVRHTWIGMIFCSLSPRFSIVLFCLLIGRSLWILFTDDLTLCWTEVGRLVVVTRLSCRFMMCDDDDLPPQVIGINWSAQVTGPLSVPEVSECLHLSVTTSAISCVCMKFHHNM